MRGAKGEKGIYLLLALLFLLILLFAFFLVTEQKSRNERVQSVVELNGIEYGEAFLKEAEKLPGIQSISPVLEVPIRLRIKDYEMDTVLYGVNLDELRMEVLISKETSIGSQPVLLVGKNAFTAMADQNGHFLSENQAKRFLTETEKTEISLFFSSEGEKEGVLSAKLGGVLKTPDDRIFLSYSQAEELLKKYAMDCSVKAILLTVQGEKNLERAMTYFSPKEG